MKHVSSLSFTDNTDARNRYVRIDVDPVVDTNWLIELNGTDSNGDVVTPLFITIDNYDSGNSVAFDVDGLSSSVGPYSIIVVQINPLASELNITATGDVVTVWISEKKLPVNEGSKYQQSPIRTYIKYFTSGASFVVPSDWSNFNNRVHCIGAGADGSLGNGANNGGRGGGGGAYARKNNMVLVPGASVAIQIGAGNSGTDTFVVNNATLKAKAAAANSINGGTAAASNGDFRQNGGNGFDNTASALVGGGGGGAGSIDAGGNNAGSDGSGGDGGNFGGGKGGAATGAAGSNGATWTQSTDGVAIGPGGGGGGSNTNGVAGGKGGNYGAGGGSGKANTGVGGLGAPGLIVLEWTP